MQTVGLHINNLFISNSATNNKPKNPQLCRPCTHGAWHVKGGGFSQEKSEGLTLMSDWPLLNNLFYNQTYNQISHINKMFSISQSATPTALFTKESLATRSVGNADLQPNKRAKESLFYDFYIELRLQTNIFQNPQFRLPCTHGAWHVKGGGFS